VGAYVSPAVLYESPDEFVVSTGEFGRSAGRRDRTRCGSRPLGCYGSTPVYTPNLDLLAHEGVMFGHAVTCSPWTRPSFASIFTSLYPSQHTAELHSSVLPDTVTTLPARYRAGSV